MRLSLRGISIAALCGAALAQAGTGYQSDHLTVAFGGGHVSGGTYSATVSIGQIDAMSQPSTAGEWSVSGGFWPIQAAGNDQIFTHGFEDQ